MATWEYLSVSVIEQRASTDEFGWLRTTYARIRHGDGRSERVDLWVWSEQQNRHHVFHKTVVQLLTELGGIGWELVTSQFGETRLYNAASLATEPRFYLKRPAS